MKRLHTKHVAAAVAALMLTVSGAGLSTASASSILLDNFSTADGYSIGDITEQDGGIGWADDTEWLRNGGFFTRNITNDGTLHVAHTSGGGSNEQMWLNREYDVPSLTSYVMETRFTLHDYGNDTLLDVRDATQSGDTFGTNSTFILRIVNDNIRIMGWDGTSNDFGDRTEFNSDETDGLFHAVKGNEYIFGIEVLGENQWRAHITDVTADETYISPTLGFRNGDGPGGHWHMGFINHTSGQTLDAEFDYFQIIPEPATLALLSLGGLLMLRRKKQS